MKKRILSILLTVCMVLTMFPTVALANPKVPTALEYATGAVNVKTTGDYYIDETVTPKTLTIYTAKGAAFWSASGTAYLDYTTFLDADIDVSGFLWAPVGNSSNPFTGKFDGQEHTIKGMNVDVNKNDTVASGGFFGYVSGATIENVGLVNSSISVTITIDNSVSNLYAGGIAGFAAGSTTILNCYTTNCNVTGSYLGTTDDAPGHGRANIHTGGIIGAVTDSTIISNCYNTGGNVTSSYNAISVNPYSGGIVGSTTSSTTIINCYNTSTILGNESYGFGGGIAGLARGTITNCHNIGAVKGFTAGGIVAMLDGGGTIANCYNSGAVNADADFAYGGGIAGSVQGTISKIINCYNTGTVYAGNQGFSGGIMGGLDAEVGNQITVINCYNTGDISSSGGNVGGISGIISGTVANCYYKQGATQNTIWVDVTITGCGTFDDSGKLTAGGANEFGGQGQTLADYADTLVNALNGWVDAQASSDYCTWEVGADGNLVMDKVWIPSYEITASTTTNGSFTVKVGDSHVTKAAEGDAITITPTADSGYELDAITLTKTGDTTSTAIGNSFTMPAYAVTINVTFKVNASAHTPVGNIIGVPTQATTGTDLLLSGMVMPKEATNHTILWSVKNQGATGATIAGGNKLKTIGTGTVTVTARVVNGLSSSTDYTKDFTITVIPAKGKLSGMVVDESSSPVSGATVSLLPSSPLLTTTTSGDGSYSISNVPNGNNYSIVIEKSGITITDKVNMNATSVTKNMKFLGGKKSTIVENKPGTLPISVNGMNNLLDTGNMGTTLNSSEQTAVSGGGSAELKLIAEKKTDTEIAEDKGKIETIATDKQLGLFIDLSMYKTVKESSGTAITIDEKMTTLASIVEITLPIPAELQGKAGLTVYRVHDGMAQALPQGLADANADGEYFTICPDSTYITLYVKNFSTYAIGYTAYNVSISGIGTGGSGAGKYMPSDTVTINAGTKAGYSFTGWTVNSGGVTLGSATSASTTFTMPVNTVSLTANWKYNGGGSGDNGGGSGGNGGSGNGGSGGSGGSNSGGSSSSGSGSGSGISSNSNTPTTGTGGSFHDVNTNDWFYDSVINATKKGWLKGVNDNAFSPNLDTTRGMIVTILQRMENGKAANRAMFNDVKADAYYANAVAWASENKIAEGYSNENFGPDDSITREQLASILYRYASWKGYDVSKTASLDSFTDEDSTSEYAKKAMGWAVASGLISGIDNGTLAPKDKATRAQVATILTRFDKLFSLK